MLTCGLSKLFGQDQVITRDNLVIEGSVLKIDSINLEIDPIGPKPFLIVPRREVLMLIYSDKTVVNFNSQISSHDINTRVAKQVVLYKVVTFDIYSPRSLYKQDKYIINEGLTFIDSLNSEEFKVILKGSFSITADVDLNIEIRNLILTMEISRQGNVSSEELLFKRYYMVLNKEGSQQLDKIHNISINTGHIDIDIWGSYLKSGNFFNKDEKMGLLSLFLTWSNF